VLERYYDAAPRPVCRTEEVGPFTLFVRDHGDGWPFYARPRLGVTDRVTPADVRRVRERQRALGVPESLEWVHETTPSLLAAAANAGLTVTRCPLLVLPDDAVPPPGGDGSATRTRVLGAGDPDLPRVAAAVRAGFAGTDETGTITTGAGGRDEQVEAGLLVVVAAYDEDGRVVGGGSHAPRGAATELTGIAVLPRARRRGLGQAITAALVADARRAGSRTVFLSAQDDAVARVYERVGFRRQATACTAEPA
jgi:ribosomal protein S18 acetylase RimI-like enzyme